MGQSASFLMKLRPLLVVGLATLLALCFSGCETTATTPPPAPLGPNQARVTGHKATFTNGVTILMRSLAPGANPSWTRELILPAGENRIGIRYETIMSGPLQQAITDIKAEVIDFTTEAGHEYFAQMSGLTIFTMGYRITDQTTGQVVIDTKPSKQRAATAR
jgi:hypothetical protein